MRPYYFKHRDYLLAYAKRYREQNKELIKYKLQQIKVLYIIRESENGSIIKEYKGYI
jgi:hypothetical protein